MLPNPPVVVSDSTYNPPTLSAPSKPTPAIVPEGYDTEVLVNNQDIWLMADPNFGTVQTQISLARKSRWSTETVTKVSLTKVTDTKTDYSYPVDPTSLINRMFKYSDSVYVEGPEGGKWKEYDDDFKVVKSGLFKKSEVQLQGVGVHYLEVLPPESFTEVKVPLRIAQTEMPELVYEIQFDGKEQSKGTGKVKLSSRPKQPIEVVFIFGNYVNVDADNDLSNGYQFELVFTSSNWNTFQEFNFIAERDANSQSEERFIEAAYARPALYEGEPPADKLIPGTNSKRSIGIVQDTYVPDTSRFNIVIDTRYAVNLPAKYKPLMEEAAKTWEDLIKNEYPTQRLQLYNTFGIQDANGTPDLVSKPFFTDEDCDDVVVYISEVNFTNSNQAANGSSAITNDGPRVGQITIDPGARATLTDDQFKQLFRHEIGHVLTMVGLHNPGKNYMDLTNHVFTGPYTKAANGNVDLPLQTSNEHPADSVNSILSYGTNGIYAHPGPTAIDKAMLADHGFIVVGVND